MSFICKQLYSVIPTKIILLNDSFRYDDISKHEKSRTSIRDREHYLGRKCAKKGLIKLGLTDTIIKSGIYGEPIWPENSIGSISHSKGHCFVAVTKRETFESIGVDVEHFNRMKKASINRITHPLESKFIGDNLERATILFAIKEAFYKAQFLQSKIAMNFKDLAVEINLTDCSAAVKWIDPKVKIRPNSFFKWKLYFEFNKRRVYTICYKE